MQVGFPDDHETAIGKRGDLHRILVVRRRVDSELTADLGSAGIKALTVHAVSAAVRRIPDDDKSAALERGDLSIILTTGNGRIDPKLRTRLVAVCIISLPYDTLGIAEGIARPNDDKSAIAERADRHIFLGSSGCRIHAELSTDRVPVGVVPLAMDAVEISVLTIRLPDDDESAIVERHNFRIVLGTAREGVDLKLGANRVVTGIETLPKNPSARTVLAVVRLPDDHVTSVGEHGHRGVVLITGRLSVDLEL